MANLNIAIQIAAKDNASGPIGRIRGALGGLQDSAGRGFAGLQSVATVAGGALLGAAGLAAGAIGGIGAAAFGVSNEVDTATANIRAALGTTAEEAERLGGVAAAVWGNNFSGSIQEAGAAVAVARQQMGELADDELQRAAENAFRLQDTFGVDVPESITAANTLMERFGLTSDEAFDFITTGYQRGLNASDDFLDTIGEYSNQFGDVGFSAGQFFSILETGQQAGVLGTDKIADAVKEMNLRLTEGGDEVANAWNMAGGDFERASEMVSSGQRNWGDYFDSIVQGLSEIEDPIERQQAQVAIFGTMAEDLGVSFTEGLSSVNTAIEDMAGATDTLDAKYDTLGSALEGFKRQGMLALQPIGDLLLGMANSALPLVERGFAFFETNVVPAIQMAADYIAAFFDLLGQGLTPLDAFIELMWDIAPQGVLDALLQLRDDILPGLVTWFETSVQPIIDTVTQFVSWNDVLMALGVVIGTVVLGALGSLVVAAAPVIAVAGLLIGGIALLRNAWENNWGGIQDKTAVVTAWLQTNIPAAIDAVRNFITSGLTAIQNFWSTHGTTIMAVVQRAFDFIRTNIQTALAVVSSIMAAFKAAREGDWRAFGENLRKAWDTAWGRIKEIFTGAKEFLTGAITGWLDDIRSRWNGIDWGELARETIRGIADGLRNGAGAIADAARDAAQAALDAAKGFLGISSRSKVFYEVVGGESVAGVVDRFRDARQEVARAMSDMLSPAVTTAGSSTFVASAAARGGGGTYYINIHAPGAAPGVEHGIRREIEAVMRDYGIAADQRRRV